MALLLKKHLLILVLFALLCSLVLAQDAQEDQDPAPEPSPTTVDPPTSTTDSPSPPAEPTTTTTMGPIVPGPTPTPVTPDPVFSSSDACVGCKAQYPTVRNCSARIPVTGNLTMISQVLPFYQCVCPNSGAAIDGIQQCSICFKSTGQQVYLNRVFYNVTNQDVKAMKQVCLDTSDGTKVPSGSSGRWDMLISSAGLGFLTLGVLLLGPLGGL